MSDATRMLLATPSHHGLDNAILGEAVDALGRAALASTSCADACLDEYALRRECVVACLTCADVAGVAARVLSRTARWDRTVVRSLADAAARACASCASECEAHADTAKHCQVCAEDCRRAEKACQQLLTALAAQIADVK